MSILKSKIVVVPLGEVDFMVVNKLASCLGPVFNRSVDILKKLLESSDEATKKAAKGALEKVAGSTRPAAARRAQDVLKAAEEKEKQTWAQHPALKN